MNNASYSEIVKSLSAGDLVTVASNELRKPRTLTVLGVETLGESLYVFTSSGKVRPGHVRGGAIVVDARGSVSYQATMLQAPVSVSGVSVSRAVAA